MGRRDLSRTASRDADDAVFGEATAPAGGDCADHGGDGGVDCASHRRRRSR